MSDADDKPLSPKARAAIAALDYASPSLKNASDVVPAVEAAIDRGASVRVVARSLGRPAKAAAYLRRSLERRYSIASAGETCLICEEPTSGVIGVRWSFTVPIRFLRSLLGEKAAVESVETHHAMCGRCAQLPAQRQRRARSLTRSAIGVIAIGIGLAGVGFYCFLAAKGEWLARVLLLVGGVTVLASMAAMSWAKSIARQALPRRLNHAVPTWLAFEGWQGWFDRSAT